MQSASQELQVRMLALARLPGTLGEERASRIVHWRPVPLVLLGRGIACGASQAVLQLLQVLNLRWPKRRQDSSGGAQGGGAKYRIKQGLITQQQLEGNCLALASQLEAKGLRGD